jgi:CRP-like cAMP-binding protein
MPDSNFSGPPLSLKGIESLKTRWNDYRGLFSKIHVPARKILLREGEIPRRIFCVEKGCLRISINNRDRDVTTQFFFEGDFVASIESFRRNRPSPITIQNIEPSTLIVLQKRDFERLLRDLPEMKDFLLELLFRRFEAYSRLFVSFVTQTPCERYLTLLKTQPRIIERVPQHQIASYLGITPVSLSRIRSKL